MSTDNRTKYLEPEQVDRLRQLARLWKTYDMPVVSIREVIRLCDGIIALCDELHEWQEHSYSGHIVKCPVDGANLTSLLMCPRCGVRYELQPATQEPQP